MSFSFRRILIGLAAALVVGLPLGLIASPLQARALAIAGLCLVLWLSEAVPAFVPTLLLGVLVPVVLAPLDGRFNLTAVLGWGMDPVLALFLGGFALGAATERYGFDRRLAQGVLGLAGTSDARLLALVMLLTAFLSMWLSNIAASVLMLACLRPMLAGLAPDAPLRRTLLVGLALGADLGGIATPIGSGPNAIAMAAVAQTQPLTFLDWMTFALPLVAGLLAAAWGLLWLRLRRQTPARQLPVAAVPARFPPLGRREWGFLAIVGGTIGLWLTEPLHGIPAAVVAIGATAMLFLTRLLGPADLRRLDWGTLLLIAGGITLGRLLEQAALVRWAAELVRWETLHPTVGLLVLCLASAFLSALMSNTATVVLLIPFAHALFPAPSTTILLAVAASLGMPFVISTPPNALVFGEGGLKTADLFWPGIVLMVLGCVLLAVTGPIFLKWAGIP